MEFLTYKLFLVVSESSVKIWSYFLSMVCFSLYSFYVEDIYSWHLTGYLNLTIFSLSLASVLRAVIFLLFFFVSGFNRKRTSSTWKHRKTFADLEIEEVNMFGKSSAVSLLLSLLAAPLFNQIEAGNDTISSSKVRLYM